MSTYRFWPHPTLDDDKQAQADSCADKRSNRMSFTPAIRRTPTQREQ